MMRRKSVSVYRYRALCEMARHGYTCVWATEALGEDLGEGERPTVYTLTFQNSEDGDDFVFLDLTVGEPYGSRLRQRPAYVFHRQMPGRESHLVLIDASRLRKGLARLL